MNEKPESGELNANTSPCSDYPFIEMDEVKCCEAKCFSSSLTSEGPNA